MGCWRVWLLLTIAAGCHHPRPAVALRPEQPTAAPVARELPLTKPAPLAFDGQGVPPPPARTAVALQGDAFRKLTRPEGVEPLPRNRALHRLLVDGATVEYRDEDGAVRGAQVRVIDFDDPERNDWLAVNQFSVTENKHTRRPDVVLFINGLPLAVLELKNAAAENATMAERLGCREIFLEPE